MKQIHIRLLLFLFQLLFHLKKISEGVTYGAGGLAVGITALEDALPLTGGLAAGQVNNQAHKPTPRSSTPKAVAAGGPKAAALGSQGAAAERASKGSRGGSSPSSKKAALKAADEKKEKSGKKPSKKEEKPKEEKPKKEETRKKLGAGLFGGKRKK